METIKIPVMAPVVMLTGVSVSSSRKEMARSLIQVKLSNILGESVLCKHGLNFSKAGRCLCSFQCLLVEKPSWTSKGSHNIVPQGTSLPGAWCACCCRKVISNTEDVSRLKSVFAAYTHPWY